MLYKGHNIEKAPHGTRDGKDLYRVDLRHLKTGDLINADACPHFKSYGAGKEFVNWLYEMRRILYSPEPKEATTSGKDNGTPTFDGSDGANRTDTGGVEMEGSSLHASLSDADEPEHDEPAAHADRV